VKKWLSATADSHSDSADPDTILTVMHAGADAFVYPPVCESLIKALDRMGASLQKQRQGAPAAVARSAASFASKAAAGRPRSPVTRRLNWRGRAPKKSCSRTSIWMRGWWDF
jgi:hypothetical protein